jgi:hypothetical protein
MQKGWAITGKWDVEVGARTASWEWLFESCCENSKEPAWE